MSASGWLVAFAVALGPQAQDSPRFSAEGRFLYADDDDWDWASPGNAAKPCGLAVYGRMPWSALDWMEEGLTEVRGVLIGTPPALGDYLTMAALNKVRSAGPKRGYDQIAHTPDILANLLKDKKPPNLIIIMQDIGDRQPPVTGRDVEAALELVRRGGRLIILDDWRYYRALAAPFADKKRFAKEAVAPIDPKLGQEVEQKVRMLGADDFRTREKAQAELIKMGKSILPFLERIQPKSAEAERRLQVILRVLRPVVPQLPAD